MNWTLAINFFETYTIVTLLGFIFLDHLLKIKKNIYLQRIMYKF
jgi:hypothetical protein